MNWMQRVIARKHEESEVGFTLIELLVVVLVLGVLSAIVVVSIGGFSGSATKQACVASGQAGEAAAAAYYADNNNAWPGSLGALVPKYLKTDPSANPDWGGKLNYNAGTGQVDTTGC